MQKTISLNVLDNVEIATPCTASWEEMTGNDQTRYCSHCSLNVYNLSAMTREEATGIIAEAEGRVCIRLYRRTDGTVLTQDCPTGLRAARERVWLSVRNIAATVVTLVAGIVGFGTKQAWAQGGVASSHIMGGIRPARTELVESNTQPDTVATQPDTNAVDDSRMMIMGKMTISRTETTPAPITLEPIATRSVALELALAAPAVIEPLKLTPMTTETGDPEPRFMMGEMLVIDRPTPVTENPVVDPVCDPDVPVVNAVTGPDIK